MAEMVNRRIDVSFATFFRLLAVVALAWAWLRLWYWFLLLVAAACLAVALDPLVEWLDAHRIRRPIGSFLVVLVLAGVIVAFFSISGATLKEEAGMLGGRLQETQQQIEGRMPEPIKRMLSRGESDPSPISGYAMTLGRAVLTGVMSIGIALILTIYLLLD